MDQHVNKNFGSTRVPETVAHRFVVLYARPTKEPSSHTRN